MKKKEFITMVFLGIFCMVFMAVCPSSSLALGKKVVAYIGYSMEKPYWVKMGNYIKVEADKMNMKFIDLTPPSLNNEEHRQFTEYAIEQGVDAIIFGANDVSIVNEAFDKALVKNIPIIAIDTEVIHPAVKGFIVTDSLKSAQIAGRYIVEKTHGRGTVLILGGTKGHPNGDARRDGVTETALAAGMKVIFKQADWDPIKAYHFTKQEMTRDNDISAIFSCWGPGISIAAKVLEKLGMSNTVLLVGFDGLEEELQEIRTGEIDATIAQPMQQIAHEGVLMVRQMLEGKEAPGKIIIPGILITKDNINNYQN